MKIEKLNDNQIRCTLTQEDLAARHLKLSELAYGSEKAKSLFRDMMQQASFDYGFEADDTPLMIEAIPSSAGSIVLIITKVEDPEELDTRFSRFTHSEDSSPMFPEHLEKLEGAEEFFDLLNKVKEAAADVRSSKKESEETTPSINVRLFSFSNIDLVIRACHLLSSSYSGASTLYFDKENETYILGLTQSDYTNNEFNRFCNMLSEYGTLEKATNTVLAFLEEHCTVVISADAVQKLASI